MDGTTTDCGAFSEAVAFLNYFNDLPDPRQRGKVMYPLDEILLLALLAVLAGADSFVEIARFGCKKRALLRRFRPFLDGTPSHDHLGDIFAALDAAHFQRCFVAWVASLIGVPAGVVAIDSLPLRRRGVRPCADPAEKPPRAPFIWSPPPAFAGAGFCRGSAPRTGTGEGR
jgi:DDE_Tnp_1-associated